MDLKTRMEVLPCGMCEDMISCDNCLFRKEAKELYNEIFNQALEDAEKRYREWSKTEYGKIVDDDVLPLRVLRSLRK